MAVGTRASQVIEADLTWIEGAFHRNVRLVVDDAGRIVEVDRERPDAGSANDPGAGLRAGPRPATTKRLARRALLPGLVNAHSHAFQRGLRGRGERFDGGSGTFWAWREAMYHLVRTMNVERCFELSRRSFREMLAGGVTTVGEFHYLHHRPGTHDFAFDEIVLEAAADAGIRIALLYAYYARGGFDAPLDAAQQSFAIESPAAYWDRIDALAERLDPATQTLGVVAHSVRAAPIGDIAALHEEASRRGLVFHMHLEEQPREIEDCLRHEHRTPMALVNERLAVDPRFTAVHCTHTAAADMEAFLGAGGNVCLCPLTEANLGDGLADVPFIRRHGGRVCLGTDSNARVSMLEEMRWLELGQRLRTRTRGVVVDPATGRPGPALLESAARHGARSLGLPGGVIAPGRLADLFAVDLEHPLVAGWTEEMLLDSLIFGGGHEVIREVAVGGRWVGE